jgi:hypothetical protein
MDLDVDIYFNLSRTQLFSLEYVGELHIFVLNRREIGPLQTPPPHSGPSCEGLRAINK